MHIDDPDKISIMKLNDKFRETFLGSVLIKEEEPPFVNSASDRCKFKSILKPSNYLKSKRKDDPVCFTVNDNIDLRLNFENVDSEKSVRQREVQEANFEVRKNET